MSTEQNTIWQTDADIERLNQFSRNSMLAHCGIEYTEIGPDYLIARMPVDHRTRQPFGILHGGASAMLAETVGSTAANLTLVQGRQHCVGLDINANHVRAVREGWVYGRAEVLHLGRSTQVWQIAIRNEQSELVCIARLTMAILSSKQ